MAEATIAGKGAGVHPEEAAKAMAASMKGAYHAKSFAVPAAAGADISVKDDEGLFTKFEHGHHITVQVDDAISIKLVSKNDPTPDEIPVTPAAPFSWHSNEFTDVKFVRAVGIVNVILVIS